MELPGDCQEHFYMNLIRFGNNVGNLFATKTQRIKEKQSKRMSEKKAVGATNDKSVHDEASWHALAQLQQ